MNRSAFRLALSNATAGIAARVWKALRYAFIAGVTLPSAALAGICADEGGEGHLHAACCQGGMDAHGRGLRPALPCA